MKHIISLSIITTLLVSPVFATEGAKDSPDAKAAQTMQTCPYYSKSMMTPEQFKTMHDHMQQMQSLMDSIKQEKDPQKYWQLMHQHMMSMSEGMHMMGPMMHGSMMNGAMMDKPMMHGDGSMMSGNGKMMQGRDGKGMKPMDMEQQMHMMQQRMGMMQMMMEQMMEHEMQRERGNHSAAKNP